MTPPGAEVLRALGLPADTVVTPAGGGASGAAWRVQSDDGARVLRRSGTASQADGRLAAIDAARAAGLPAPELLARATTDVGEVVLLSWLPGTHMLAAMEAEPGSARHLGRMAGDLQRSLHDIAGPSAVTSVTEDVHRPFRAGARLPGIPDGDRLLHLDWHPLNLLVGPDAGAITGIVDWDNARRGHPLLDLARTRSILTVEPALATLRPRLGRALPEFVAGWTDGYGGVARAIPPACLRWAGAVMLDDLAPRYGADAGELEPLRRWTESWS